MKARDFTGGLFALAVAVAFGIGSCTGGTTNEEKLIVRHTSSTTTLAKANFYERNTAAAFSADTEYVAVIRDNRLGVYSGRSRDGQLIGHVPGVIEPKTAIALSGKEQLLATGKTEVKLWDLAKKNERGEYGCLKCLSTSFMPPASLQRQAKKVELKGAKILALAFSSDGRYLAGTGFGIVAVTFLPPNQKTQLVTQPCSWIWNLQTGKQVVTYLEGGHQIAFLDAHEGLLAIIGNGNSLLSLTLNGTLRILEDERVGMIATSGSYVAYTTIADTKISVRDAGLRTIGEHTTSVVTQLSVSKHGQVAFSTWNEELHSLHLSSKPAGNGILQTRGLVYGIQFQPNGNLVVADDAGLTWYGEMLVAQ